MEPAQFVLDKVWIKSKTWMKDALLLFPQEMVRQTVMVHSLADVRLDMRVKNSDSPKVFRVIHVLFSLSSQLDLMVEILNRYINALTL